MATKRTASFIALGIGMVLMLAMLSMGSSVRLAHADDFTTPDPQSQVATSTDGTGGKSSDTGGSIDTGNATATSTVDNNLNTNNVYVLPTTSGKDEPGKMGSSNLTASTTDTGVLDSAATSTADTGTNAVIGGEGANSIHTGDAIATSNVINEVNTNIFNSDGLILFINQLFGGGLDLNAYDLSFFFAGGPGASPTVNSLGQPQCTLLTCLNSSSLNVLNNNTATVTNSVIVRAATGANTASSTGDTNIGTGNAYAAANLVNLVNTNIVNSSYLLLAFNNFGDINDNITLPGSDFFQRLFVNGAKTTAMHSSTYTVNDTNDINFTGTTTAQSDSGNNAALEQATSTDQVQATGQGTVNTGHAYSSANTYNELNTDSVGGTSVYMLFRVAGHFGGSVLGLPDGIAQRTIQDGQDELIELSSIGASTTPALEWLAQYKSSHFLASSTSDAAIDNNVSASAETGMNQATSDTGNATVDTGNAYAAASVVNLVNTNIIGQNWIFAIFNVFGNLNGNIVFGGSPVLTITASPSAASVTPGGDVTYTFGVTNSGNADANNVVLNTSYDNTLMAFDDGDATPTGRAWHLGLIRKGETVNASFTGHIGTNFPQNAAANLPFTAAAVNDNIASPATSNTASAPIVVAWPGATNTSSGGGGGGGGGGGWSGAVSVNINPDPQIKVVNTMSVATTTAPTSIDYKVVVTNEKSAGPVYFAQLTDTMTDPFGGTVYTRSWDLDTIAPGDEITLTYSVAFGTTTRPGLYTNIASVTGQKNNPNMYYGTTMTPASATGVVEFLDNGMVLGDATSSAEITDSSLGNNSCKVLKGFVKPGQTNNAADVFKLQVFLNAHGDRLSLNGRFDAATVGAVNRFQTRYALDILKPLGLKKPTGNVLGATQTKINQVACSDVPKFSLTQAQLQQMAILTAGKVTRTAAPVPHTNIGRPNYWANNAAGATLAPKVNGSNGTTGSTSIGNKIGGLLNSIWGRIR